METTKMELNRKARQMEKYPDMKIIIEGHTCNLGVTETNLVIGQMRADVAKNYLVNQGIAPERIKTVSKAETEPLLPNTSEDNRRKNRRIEFVVEH
ncbi:hypothetical protein FACS1894199_16380 [Bacteroidia bacterium]|nr:hypothetical protein FACS1894199_16380 [Bacteroidia bacterium]